MRVAYHRIIGSTNPQQHSRGTNEGADCAGMGHRCRSCGRVGRLRSFGRAAAFFDDAVARAATAPTDAPTPPAGDPSIPPGKAAPAPNSDDGLPASAVRSDVTSRDKDRRMPLPGQADEHSTSDFAKRGNRKPGN